MGVAAAMLAIAAGHPRIAASDGFTTFRLEHFSLAERVDPAISSSVADPDGDGVPNLLEYLAGRDPRESDPPAVGQLAVRSMPGGGLTHTFDSRNDLEDVALSFEQSDDLVRWTPALPAQYTATASGNTTRHALSYADAAASSRWLRAVARHEPPPPELIGTIPGQWALSQQAQPDLAAVLARPPASVPVAGLYVWASDYLMHRAVIRDIGWRQFRLSGPLGDPIFRAFSEDGARVMLTLSARRPFATPGFPNGEWRNRGTFETDEAFIVAYLADLTAALDRYGPEGTFWAENPDLTHRPLEAIEIFNEPNFWYLDLTPEQNAANVASPDPAREAALLAARKVTYARLLPAAYQHLRARWPDLLVVGFGTGGAAAADIGFIRDVHAANPSVAASYDVLSTHPYVVPVPPEVDSIRTWGFYSMASSHAHIRQTMRLEGTSDRPVWWTELNWPVTGGRYDDGPGTSLFGRTISHELQAAYLVRAHARALRLGVDRLMIMSMRDTDGTNSGVLNMDLSWRPAAHALATFIALLPHPRLTAAQLDGVDGRYAYRVAPDVQEPDRPEVLMAWAVTAQGEPTPIAWTGRRVHVLDHLGQSLRTVDGQPGTTAQSLPLILGPEPVYLIPEP